MRRLVSETARNLLSPVWLATLPLVACSGPQSRPTPTPEPAAATAPRMAEQPIVVDGDQRLPRGVEPLSYRLHFVVDPRKDEFSGTTEIEIRVVDPTRVIVLHAEGLAFREVYASASGARLAPRVRAGKNAGLALEFDNAVSGELTLHFDYTAQLDEVPMSLYRAKDGDEWYAFTQFEALAAREAYPCFDEPRFKTPYTTSVTTPAGMLAVSNTPLSVTTPLGDMTRYDFQTTPPLPSYLVALAVGNFDIADNPAPPAGQPPQRVLTVQGKGEHTSFATKQTSTILSHLTEYFGSPYPYAKLDQLAVPSFRAGAMENPGLVTYREKLLLVDEQHGSATDKLYSQSVIAHELSHMWFGNLVTMQWWDDVWLNEAFASWMSIRTLAEVAPETEPELQAVSEMVEVMDQDALSSATPIRKQIRNSGDVQNAFDRITYVKGQSVLRMLENWAGPDRFQQGIRNYLKEHAWQNATMFDLFKAVDAAAERRVSSVAQAFVEETGVPLVSVRLSCEDDHPKVTLMQRRFAPAGQVVPQQVWAIPVCLEARRGKQRLSECLLFDQTTKTLDVDWGFCPDFVHPNAGEKSYYRWQLEPERFRALTRKYRSQLSIEERVALPSHSYALLEAAAIDGADYVDAIDALSAETHWLVLSGVIHGLERLSHILEEQPARQALARFTRRLLEPHARRIGFMPKPTEPASAGLIREELFYALASVGNDPATLRLARATAQKVLKDPSKVAPEIVRQSLIIAALNGDKALHEGMVKELETTRSPTLRHALVSALARFRDPELSRMSYGLILKGALLAQDYHQLPRVAGQDPALQATFWSWYVQHERELIQVLGEASSGALPWVAAGFCDARGISEAEQHFQDVESLGPGASGNLRQALETAKRCLAMRQRHGAALATALQRANGR